LKAGPLRCIEAPAEALHGWEAHVYRFRLQGATQLPSPFNCPLTLRAYDNPHALSRARHEFAALKWLDGRGFPVPRPLLLEERCALLGGPFLVMPWIDGVSLLDWLRCRFTRVLNVAEELAQLHLALHALAPSEFPAPRKSFLARRLGELEGMVLGRDLEELRPGLAWLRRHRPKVVSPPSVLHLDFHPVNVVVEEGQPRVVLDWSEADVGDRHADIAMTLVLLRTAPVLVSTWSERLMARPARWCVARRYLRTYRKHFPVHDGVLSYYMAWAALRRLAVCATWRRSGPWATGFKASSLRHANPRHEAALARCFQRVTGLSLAPVL
jgi:aminoglycoside phosphotransferase (APT) family kinase protein